MTVALTYDGTLSRVKLALSAAPAEADYALVERSIDGVVWSTVRGGDQVALTAGAGTLYDYEFAANVLNTYRVSFVDSATPVVLAAGASASAVNASVTPTLPAGLVEGSMVILLASIRNSGTGTVNLPANWTALAGTGTNFLVAARRWGNAAWETGGGAAAPLVTFAGGAALQDTMAVMFAAKNINFPANTPDNMQLNGAAQNILTPGYGRTPFSLHGRAGWKQDDNTTVTDALPTVANVSSVAGDDSSMAVVAGISDAFTGAYAPVSLVVTGGAAAISRGMSFSIPKATWVRRETQTITPALTQIWLKSVARPYLNKAVTVVGFDDEELESRSEAFDVVGRTYPVAVTDVRAASVQVVTVTTSTLADADDFQNRLMGGDVAFLHTPDTAGGCPLRTRYALIGKVNRRKGSGARTGRRFFDLPLIEVAAPSSILVGNTILWSDVVASYATWADVIAAKPTWSDLVDQIAVPGDVIVP